VRAVRSKYQVASGAGSSGFVNLTLRLLDSFRFGFAEPPGRRQGKSKRLNSIKVESFSRRQNQRKQKKKKEEGESKGGKFFKTEARRKKQRKIMSNDQAQMTKS
jgi:hypothetical protein